MDQGMAWIFDHLDTATPKRPHRRRDGVFVLAIAGDNEESEAPTAGEVKDGPP